MHICSIKCVGLVLLRARTHGVCDNTAYSTTTRTETNQHVLLSDKTDAYKFYHA